MAAGSGGPARGAQAVGGCLPVVWSAYVFLMVGVGQQMPRGVHVRLRVQPPPPVPALLVFVKLFKFDAVFQIQT